MPATRQQLFDHLDGLGATHHTVEHPAVFTVAESEAIHKHELLPGGHTKNLFLKDKKGQIFLVVALNDADIDLKQLHKRIGASGRLSFGKSELLIEVLGVEPGSVTPFALINDTDQRVTVILDEAMMALAELNYHPLENTATTNIGREDFLRFIRSCGHDPQIIAVSATDIPDAPAAQQVS